MSECCTNASNTCDTCKYSIEGDITCYSPLIWLDPPEDAEWEPRVTSESITITRQEES